MAELRLAFLGPPQIVHHPLGDLTLPNRKALALLTYLAVEARSAHSRETLLGLLWPEMPDAEARNNLRVTWAWLRGRLGDEAVPFLLSTCLELQFNRDSDASLDMADFHALLEACHQHAHERRDGCRECQQRLARAAGLYRGEFLAGFFLEGCPAFEEWLFVQRERLHVQVIELLDELARFHEDGGRADRAEEYTRRQIELDPLREDAHRRLMRLFEQQGRRTAALAQFEACRKVLEEELRVAPDAETVSLYQQTQAREAIAIAEDGNLREVASDAATLLAYTLMDICQWEEARILFAQALQHWQAMGQAASIAETRVGLAEAAWQQGELAAARAIVDEVEPFLHSHDLSGAKEPLRMYLTCYYILQAYDSRRAEAMLRRAAGLLQEQAARITADDLRRTFLENVAAHREIIAAVKTRGLTP